MKTSQNFPGIHQEHRKGVIISIIIFVLIIAGMFTYAFLKKNEQEASISPDVAEEEQSAGPYDYITRVNGTHYYIDGVHTIVGEIPMPTPCDLLESQVTIAESYPEQITIDFTVINNAETCAQMITPARFMVEATASPEASIRARLMGREIELNLTPAPEGETPDDFELFLKG